MALGKTAKRQNEAAEKVGWDLIRELRRTRENMRRLQSMFDLITDEQLIESCIYEMKAAATRMDYLIRCARAQGIACPMERFIDYEMTSPLGSR